VVTWIILHGFLHQKEFAFGEHKIRAASFQHWNTSGEKFSDFRQQHRGILYALLLPHMAKFLQGSARMLFGNNDTIFQDNTTIPVFKSSYKCSVMVLRAREGTSAFSSVSAISTVDHHWITLLSSGDENEEQILPQRLSKKKNLKMSSKRMIWNSNRDWPTAAQVNCVTGCGCWRQKVVQDRLNKEIL
jgi:hypothetical protein